MAMIIAGRQFWLWRAVDAEREVLESARATTARQDGSRETHAQAAQETGLRTRRAGDNRQVPCLFTDTYALLF
jgi:hypothetical protein